MGLTNNGNPSLIKMEVDIKELYEEIEELKYFNKVLLDQYIYLITTLHNKGLNMKEVKVILFYEVNARKFLA